MSRRAHHYFLQWLNSPDRKPMVIRGARQVGKTWLVREAAKNHKQLFELNFEKQPGHFALFESNDSKTILKQLMAHFQQPIEPANALLFLDEIQAAPLLLSKLRWFAEDLPELAVVAAGSLLEFTLNEHEFSMPVGRTTYLHLEPLSFEEFLDALEKKFLLEYLNAFQWHEPIPAPIHEQLLTLFKEYLIVGGMPAAIYSWAEYQSLEKINQIHHDLLANYRDDFSKYAKRISTSRLEEVMMAIPTMFGEKFVFSRVNQEIQAPIIKSALHLLSQARLAYPVKACAGNGVPLLAEVNEKFFKIIFLDVGLSSAILGLKLHQIQKITDLNLINAGGISEQLVGQQLRVIEPFYVQPQLYYWIRAQKNSNAEVDYLLQHGPEVIPIEVKSGSTGSLKSLHYFMSLKKLSRALRINSEPPSLTPISIKIHTGENVNYQLYSLPFYLICQMHRLLNSE